MKLRYKTTEGIELRLIDTDNDYRVYNDRLKDWKSIDHQFGRMEVVKIEITPKRGVLHCHHDSINSLLKHGDAELVEFTVIPKE